MIRETTKQEFARLSRGHCPTCDGVRFQPGPRGGLAQNIECVECGARYNVTIAGRNQSLVWAQVIGERPSPDDWAAYRAKWRPLRLPEAAK